jgi:hypothetical protein
MVRGCAAIAEWNILSKWIARSPSLYCPLTVPPPTSFPAGQENEEKERLAALRERLAKQWRAE